MDLQEIKKELKNGDMVKIAESVDTSPEYVWLVLSGKRRHVKGKGKKIFEQAIKLIQLNKKFIQNEYAD